MPPKTYAAVMLLVNSCSVQQFISYDFGLYKLNVILITIDSKEDVASRMLQALKVKLKVLMGNVMSVVVTDCR